MDNTGSEQIANRRRASTACKRCRAKKVRCDVILYGLPCSNCRMDSLECTVVNSKRGKTKRRRCQKTREAEPFIISSPDEPAQSPTDIAMAHPPQEASSLHHDSQKRYADDGSSRTMQREEKLPHYTKPSSSLWPREDVQFLRAKGALTVSCPQLRYALLESYINWVHPFCPLLDLDDFLSAVLSNGSEGQVSLLLLHAVMFAGSAFIDISHLRAAGFESRIAARKHFFMKIKLLYDFKYEDDRLRIVQSLLLMSYWQEKHEDSTNHWYWAAMACVVARTIGLFRNPARSSMSARKKQLWKRVGWSCLLRDHILSLGVRQRPKISTAEFELPLLVETDFEVITLPGTTTAAAAVLRECEFLRDSTLQRKLARLCIEKTKLCILIGEVFRTQYVELNPKLGLTTGNTEVLFPKTPAPDLESAKSIEMQLQAWLQGLPKDLQYQQDIEPLLDRGEDVLILHRTLLYMLYHAINCTLYHPQMLSFSSQSASDDLSLVKRRIRHSAALITRHFEDLQNFELIRFLPSASVTILLTAAVNHLVEHKTSSGEHGERYLRHFWDCVCYLKSLRGIHVYAESASLFLHSVARQAGVRTMGTFSKDKDDLGVWAAVHTPGRLLVPTPPPGGTDLEETTAQRGVGNSGYGDASIFPPSLGCTSHGQGGDGPAFVSANEDFASLGEDGGVFAAATQHDPLSPSGFAYQSLWNMWESHVFDGLEGYHVASQGHIPGFAAAPNTVEPQSLENDGVLDCPGAADPHGERQGALYE